MNYIMLRNLLCFEVQRKVNAFGFDNYLKDIQCTLSNICGSLPQTDVWQCVNEARLDSISCERCATKIGLTRDADHGLIK